MKSCIRRVVNCMSPSTVGLAGTASHVGGQVGGTRGAYGALL